MFQKKLIQFQENSQWDGWADPNSKDPSGYGLESKNKIMYLIPIPPTSKLNE